MNFVKYVKSVKEYIEKSLEDIIGCDDDFNLGQRYAYIEILELMQNQTQR